MITDEASAPTSQIPHGLYLSFDYGERYIGVASGHSQTGTASPAGIINNDSGSVDWAALDKIFQQWQPVGLVVGIPLHMDGSEQALGQHVRGFIKRLAKRYTLPVYPSDERLTTREASSIIRENRRRGKRRKTSKADLDSIAAALILEKWFGTHHEFN